MGRRYTRVSTSRFKQILKSRGKQLVKNKYGNDAIRDIPSKSSRSGSGSSSSSKSSSSSTILSRQDYLKSVGLKDSSANTYNYNQYLKQVDPSNAVLYKTQNGQSTTTTYADKSTTSIYRDSTGKPIATSSTNRKSSNTAKTLISAKQEYYKQQSREQSQNSQQSQDYFSGKDINPVSRDTSQYLEVKGTGYTDHVAKQSYSGNNQLQYNRAKQFYSQQLQKQEREQQLQAILQKRNKVQKKPNPLELTPSDSQAFQEHQKKYGTRVPDLVTEKSNQKIRSALAPTITEYKKTSSTLTSFKKSDFPKTTWAINTKINRKAEQLESKRSRFAGEDTIKSLTYATPAVVLGIIKIPLNLAYSITHPKQTTQGVTYALKNPFEAGSLMGSYIQNNPATFTGEIIGSYLTGKLIKTGFKKSPIAVEKTEIKIPTKEGTQTIYQGVGIRFKSRGTPLIGKTEKGIKFGTPKIDLSKTNKPFIVEKASETKIILKNLQNYADDFEIQKFKTKTSRNSFKICKKRKRFCLWFCSCKITNAK